LGILFFFSCYNPYVNPNASEKNIDFLIDKGRLSWEQRTSSGSLENANHFITLATKERPNDFNLSILHSKIKFNLAKYIENKPEIKKQLFLEGAEISKNAIFNHPSFDSILIESKEYSSSELIFAINKAPKILVPGLFWWAENLAHHLNGKSVLERLNHRELLEVLMHRVISLDPGFNYSGPYRFFGSLYTRIPGVELTQSETYFKQAINSNSDYLGNLVSMAEYFHQKKGNREQFNKILLEVSKTDIDQFPEIMNQNYFSKKYALELLEKESLLFE
jgi:hypothetical protein